jgi:hypothetical protein
MLETVISCILWGSMGQRLGCKDAMYAKFDIIRSVNHETGVSCDPGTEQLSN